VGKRSGRHSRDQEDINQMMLLAARQGKRVVRLKGGDPLIFARAGEEIAACRAAGIAVEIVPGITAAQGAASRLGVPLTDRQAAQRLLYVTGHDKSGSLPKDFDWPSLIDPATTSAIYMPRKTLAALVEGAVRRGLDPDTPAVAVISATRPDQECIAAGIAELPGALSKAKSDGPALVMLGRVFAGNTAVRALHTTSGGY
jgi:uroporphyrin-III C-methyltransferase/precorrin-2 dehydrogenase/sirohydrochlorin ferrochelatase